MTEKRVRCPFCGGKTKSKIYLEMCPRNFSISCHKCKIEIIIDVIAWRKISCYEKECD